MKIDVEGAEKLVLRGAQQFMAKHSPLLLFECGPGGPQALGRTPGDLYELLTREMHYAVYFLQDWLDGQSSVSREQFESALVYPFKAFNWIAMRRDTQTSSPDF